MSDDRIWRMHTNRYKEVLVNSKNNSTVFTIQCLKPNQTFFILFDLRKSYLQLTGPNLSLISLKRSTEITALEMTDQQPLQQARPVGGCHVFCVCTLLRNALFCSLIVPEIHSQEIRNSPHRKLVSNFHRNKESQNECMGFFSFFDSQGRRAHRSPKTDPQLYKQQLHSKPNTSQNRSCAGTAVSVCYLHGERVALRPEAST